MTDHDRHVTGNHGQDHPDNSAEEDEAPEKCNRCTCPQEGYCEQLDEWLCIDNLFMAYSEAICARIGEDIDCEDAINEIYEAATAHTFKNSDTYELFSFDLPNAETVQIKLADVSPNQGNKL